MTLDPAGALAALEERALAAAQYLAALCDSHARIAEAAGAPVSQDLRPQVAQVLTAGTVYPAPAPPTRRLAPPKTKRGKRAGGRRARAKAPDAPASSPQEEARRLYESGMPVTAIATKFGVTPAAIYYWKKRDGWGAAAAPTKTATGARGRLDGLRHRCEACELVTTADPCEHCGQAAKYAA